MMYMKTRRSNVCMYQRSTWSKEDMLHKAFNLPMIRTVGIRGSCCLNSVVSLFELSLSVLQNIDVLQRHA